MIGTDLLGIEDLERADIERMLATGATHQHGAGGAARDALQGGDE